MERRKPSLQDVLNQVETDIGSLKTGLDHALSAKGEETAKRLERALDDAIRQLLSVRADLKSPVLILELIEPEEHPCDRCEVILHDLEPGEHCHGCIHEAELQTYVPDVAIASFIEPTECSAEEDPDDNTVIY